MSSTTVPREACAQTDEIVHTGNLSLRSVTEQDVSLKVID